MMSLPPGETIHMLTTGMWRFWYALSIGLHTVIKIIVKLKKYDGWTQ